jgi:hypothetical protein
MRAALALVLLLAQPVFAGGIVRSPHSGTSAQAGSLSQNFRSTVKTGGDLLRAFPPSGIGLDYSQANVFCSSSTFTAARGSAGFFCVEGDNDGTNSSALYAAAPVGNPITTRRYVCPDGPDCGVAHGGTYGQHLSGTGTQRIQTGAVSTSTGSLSCGVYLKIDNLTGTAIAAKGTSASYAFKITVSNANPSFGQGTFDSTVQNASGTSSFVAGVTSKPWFIGNPVLLGFSYKYVGSGTSELRSYMNGALYGTPNLAAIGPLRASTTPITIGAFSDGSSGLKDATVYDAFCVEKDLQDSDWAALFEALIPTPKGTNGEIATELRGGPKVCEAPGDGDGDGSNDVTVLSSARICMTCVSGQCGMHWEGNASRYQAAPTALDDASWTLTNATVTPNVTTFTAPDGSFNADKLVESTATGDHLIGQPFSPNPTDNTQIVCSVRARADGRDWLALNYLKKDGTSASCFFNIATCSMGANCAAGLTGLAKSMGTSWCRASIKGSIGAGATVPQCRVYLASADGVTSYAGDGASGAVLWQIQPEPGGFNGGFPTSPIAPYAPSVSNSRPYEGISFPPPPGLSGAEGCARVAFVPFWTGANPSNNPINFVVLSSTKTLLSTGSSQSTVVNPATAPNSSVSAGFTSGVRKVYRSYWKTGGTQYGIQNVSDGLNGTESADSSAVGTLNVLRFGINTSSQGAPAAGGILSDMAVGNSASGCQ